MFQEDYISIILCRITYNLKNTLLNELLIQPSHIVPILLSGVSIIKLFDFSLLALLIKVDARTLVFLLPHCRTRDSILIYFWS